MRVNTAIRPLATLLAVGCIGLSPVAFAGDYPCPPNRGAVTIDGDIVVKGICNLSGTKVTGNVKVIPAAPSRLGAFESTAVST